MSHALETFSCIQFEKGKKRVQKRKGIKQTVYPSTGNERRWAMRREGTRGNRRVRCMFLVCFWKRERCNRIPFHTSMFHKFCYWFGMRERNERSGIIVMQKFGNYEISMKIGCQYKEQQVVYLFILFAQLFIFVVITLHRDEQTTSGAGDHVWRLIVQLCVCQTDTSASS